MKKIRNITTFIVAFLLLLSIIKPALATPPGEEKSNPAEERSGSEPKPEPEPQSQPEPQPQPEAQSQPQERDTKEELWIEPDRIEWLPHGPIGPIPPDFFEPGSDPFTGEVPLAGDETPFEPDTVVRRPVPVRPDTIPIEMVALSLVSVEPITVPPTGEQVLDSLK